MVDEARVGGKVGEGGEGWGGKGGRGFLETREGVELGWHGGQVMERV